MKKYWKYGIYTVAVVATVSFLLSLQFEKPQERFLQVPKTGFPAPNFSLKNSNGETVSLQDYKGKIVYIDFWASWCKDCLKQVIPQRNLEKTLALNADIVFLNISVDDSESAWIRAVQRNKLTANQLISHGGDEENINSNYGINEIPRYIIVGKNGEVLNNNAPHPGEIDAAYFEQFN